MDEFGLPGFFQIMNKQMMNNPVLKPGGINFTDLGGMGDKAERWKGAVGSVS